VWGLPQAEILAKKLLRKRLKPHGYYECVNTPGLWQHASRPITFSLVVDNFGVKYVGKEHADHLISCLQRETYKLTEDLAGDLYCGISLQWDYVRRTLNISMSGYIKKQLFKYNHIMQRIQHCPYSPEPKRYGADAQSPLPHNDSRKLNKTKIKQVKKIVGSILYYARAVDMTVLMALSTIASEQTKGTKCTLEKAYQVLDYLATHPNAVVRFLRVRHGAEHPFGRIIFKQTQRAQQSMWPFFHGLITKRWRSHQIKWCFSYTVFDITICGGISGRSRTWGPISKLPRRDYF
jgi:hypothetical protein